MVLFHYNPHKIIDTLLPETPHRDTYLNELFAHQIWQDMDRGDVSTQEAVEHIHHHHPKNSDPAHLHQLITEFALHLDVIEESKTLFLELTKTHPVYILSNFQDQPFDTLLDAHPFLKKAKGMVVSGKVNMMKPEKEIYHHLLDTHNIPAKTSFFIDDRAENIQACKDVGMNGIVFDDPSSCVEKIRAIIQGHVEA